jgi:amidohydrolase
MAACDPVTVTFLGKTAHATLPEQGVDAIAMAWEAYGLLKELARREAGEKTVYIFSINCFQGGTAHNVIADQCRMIISFRYYDKDFARRVREKSMALCGHLADRYGGNVEFNWSISTPPVYNDPALAAQFAQSAERVLPGQVVDMPFLKSSEDFSWFLTQKPGLLFRFGTRNEALGCATLIHCNDFRIDETGMRSAIDVFVQFVLDRPAAM